MSIPKNLEALCARVDAAEDRLIKRMLDEEVRFDGMNDVYLNALVRRLAEVMVAKGLIRLPNGSTIELNAEEPADPLRGV